MIGGVQLGRLTLHSPHDPIAVATRLKAVVAPTLNADSPTQVTGSGTEFAMTLWVHRPRFRNSFRTALSATLEPEGSGTRIAGTLGQPRVLSIFMGCWFVFVGSFAVLGAGMALFARMPWPVVLPFVAIPLLMLGFGVLLLTIARWHARDDAARLRAFLRDTVDATDAGTERDGTR